MLYCTNSRDEILPQNHGGYERFGILNSILAESGNFLYRVTRLEKIVLFAPQKKVQKVGKSNGNGHFIGS